MLINSPNISGSLTVTGNATISGSLTVAGGISAAITGSATTASYVEYNNIANKPTLVSGSEQVSFNSITDKPTLVSGSSQVTYSGLSGIPAGIVSGSAQVSFNGITDKPTLVSGSEQVSFNGIVDKPTLVSGSAQVTYSGLSGIPSGIVSSSAQVGGYGIFATTGSNSFNGSQVVTGSLTVTGQVVAQTLNVQQVTSSIVFSSGSNIFGNSLSNTQQFTGSVSVTGSFTVTTAGTELQVTNTGVNLGNISTDNHNVTGSLRVSGSMAVTGVGTFSSSVTATQFITGGTPSNTAGFTNSFYAESNVPSLTLSNTGTNAGKFTLGATNGGFGIWNNTTSTYPLFINSSNNIGIGTTSITTSRLRVEGATSEGQSIADFVSNDTTASATYHRGIRVLAPTLPVGDKILMSVGVADSTLNMGQFYFNYVGNGSTSNFLSLGLFAVDEVLNITGAGNVGIGTTSPGVALHVIRPLGQNCIAIGESGSNQRFVFGQESSYTGNYINSTNIDLKLTTFRDGGTGGTILFYTSTDTNPAERLRITSTGTVQPGANGTQDLGTSSLRWATVFTSDLSLSNGIGDYTIVEGENDLFLYNNKQNKVYKFLVEEVDSSTATPKKS
jgi:hypothetical protein